MSMSRTIYLCALGLIQYRWLRFFVATPFLLLSILFVLMTIGETQFKTVTGVVTQVSTYVSADDNSYAYTQLRLAGVSHVYTLHRDELSPTMSEPTEQALYGAQVTIWVPAMAINGSTIGALQAPSENRLNTTKYVTTDYTHAAAARNRDLLPTSIVLLVGVGFVAYGIFGPVRRSAGSQIEPVEAGQIDVF